MFEKKQNVLLQGIVSRDFDVCFFLFGWISYTLLPLKQHVFSFISCQIFDYLCLGWGSLPKELNSALGVYLSLFVAPKWEGLRKMVQMCY
jgi:hypothetical protein